MVVQKSSMTAVVAAAQPDRGIGYQGQIPWKLPGDMKHFRQVTTQGKAQNAVIMGRKTWESIPTKYRPLADRINIILTHDTTYNVPDDEDVLIAHSLDDAYQQVMEKKNKSKETKETTTSDSKIGEIFVIGGGEIYKQAMECGYVQTIIYTDVLLLDENADTKFDAYFPELPQTHWSVQPYYNQQNEEAVVVASKEISKKELSKGQLDNINNKENEAQQKKQQEAVATATEQQQQQQPQQQAMIHVDTKSGIKYRFLKYERRLLPPNYNNNEEELQYLDLCRDILRNGVKRNNDRTGTGTLSKFGTQMRFSLRDNTLPLLTTKRTFWRGVAEELLWFISGNTNANDLTEKNIHIWDGNGSREFLDARGLGHREIGDLGPVYGFQWRHFGAKYKTMHDDYTGLGVDQLADCIDKIKNSPEDRRIIMSAWNPADLDEMALPPCHMFCQFYVDTEKNELSCQMYQRSADMGLGVPFNIASYALLTRLVAQVTGRKPGDFIHTIGDAHIYLNHIEALEEQLQRTPRPFPKLKINPDKKSIDDFEFSDFEVIGYNPHKPIKMKMAV